MASIDKIEGLRRSLQHRVKKFALEDDVTFSDGKQLPQMNNFVSRVTILDQEGKNLFFPILEFNRRVTCIEYTPKRFAANILKVVRGNNVYNYLIFASGVVVTVGNREKWSSMWASQWARILMENIRCTMIINGKKTLSTFNGLTVFKNWKKSNSVKTIYLKHDIDMKKFCKEEPGVSWDPECFPGAFMSIPLDHKPLKRCQLEPMQCSCFIRNSNKALISNIHKSKAECPTWNKNKCCKKCKMTFGIFDTGKIVMSGKYTLKEGNKVCQALYKYMKKYTLKGGLPPVQLRHHTRYKQHRDVNYEVPLDEEKEALLDHDVGPQRKKMKSDDSYKVLSAEEFDFARTDQEAQFLMNLVYWKKIKKKNFDVFF